MLIVAVLTLLHGVRASILMTCQNHVLCMRGLRGMCAAASGGIGSEPILVWLTREAPDVLLCAVVTATAALWWPDDSVGIAAKFCRSVSAASCLCMFTDLQIASATPRCGGPMTPGALRPSSAGQWALLVACACP